jgi:hypothetical protein
MKRGSITRLKGLGKGLWQKLDIAKYLTEERESWNRDGHISEDTKAAEDLRAEPSAVEMMRHAVGYPGRNFYCCERHTMEWSQWSGLVNLGLALFGAVINDGQDQYFHVTPEGLAYLKKLDERKPDR